MIARDSAPRVPGIFRVTCISTMTILIPTELRPRSLLRVSESLLEENTNGGITTVVRSLQEASLLNQMVVYRVLHAFHRKLDETICLMNKSPRHFRSSNKAHNFQIYPSCNSFRWRLSSFF